MFLRTRPRVAVVVGAALALSTLPAADSVADSAASAILPNCVSSGPLLRYLVLFDPGAPERRAAPVVNAACGTETTYYPQIGVMVATSADPGFAARLGPDRAYSAEAEAFAQANGRARGTGLAALQVPPTVLSSAPDLRMSADRTAEQWDMALIHAPQARAIDPGSPDVVVGVLDSGVDASHPDLSRAVDPSRSAGCLTGKPDPDRRAWLPTTSGHGTHVAGTIAAADDGHGVTGVAPGVRLASVKVVDDQGFIYPEYAVCGFMWAAEHHIRIANSSYSVDPWLLTCSDVSGQSVVHEALRRAVRYATAQGVLTIAATGNDGLDLANARRDPHSPDNVAQPVARTVSSNCHVLPAQLPGVVAVSAVGANGVKSSFSSFGLGVVDVTAPGGDRTQRPPSSSSGCVLSTIPDGYGYACGTSMAAPHASGVAALLASTHPQAGPQELADLLVDEADPLPCPDGDGDSGCVDEPGDSANSFAGHGLVDALKAVDSGAAAAPGSPSRPPWLTLRPAA